MFGKLLTEVKTVPPKEVDFDFINNITTNASLFRAKINSISTMEDKELYDLVKGSYQSILYEISSRQDKEYLDVFTTPKFITILTQVLNSVNLSYKEKICCNKLVYDYITLKNNDPYIKELLFILSKLVNKDNIKLLLFLELPENIATYIALARLSDLKESVNIKRVNFIIATTSPSIMTPQTIIYIYERLFDSIRELFITIMFDVYDEDEELFTEDVMEVYANISLAILTLLNVLPINGIKSILTSYGEDFKLTYKGNIHLVRFSLRSISSTDFNRIHNMVELLESEGVHVP